LAVSDRNGITMLCDWLPPEFGAVGQYALQFARDLATTGETVTLVGFSSRAASIEKMDLGTGRLTVHRLYRPAYDKNRFLERALWTLRSNLALVVAALPAMRRSREVLFTGSPPYCIHFTAPVMSTSANRCDVRRARSRASRAREPCGQVPRRRRSRVSSREAGALVGSPRATIR
jgi:hypothetical protein